MGDVETIFYEVKIQEMIGAGKVDDSKDKDPDERNEKVLTAGLTLGNFIEALIIMACRARFDTCSDNEPAEKFSELIEKHVWPFATQRRDDLLYKLTYDPGLDPILLKVDK